MLGVPNASAWVTRGVHNSSKRTLTEHLLRDSVSSSTKWSELKEHSLPSGGEDHTRSPVQKHGSALGTG